jgi:hypothetical protein
MQDPQTLSAPDFSAPQLKHTDLDIHVTPLTKFSNALADASTCMYVAGLIIVLFVEHVNRCGSSAS